MQIDLKPRPRSAEGGYVGLPDDAALIEALQKIVGNSHVVTGASGREVFAPVFVSDMVQSLRSSARVGSSNSGAY